MYDGIILFVRLVNAGRFATLAKKMGVAQSTISRKVELLEKNLGVKLLKRDSHNFELTREGDILYQNFKECEQSLAQLISPIYEDSKTVVGTLRILLPLTFSHYTITPYIADLSRDNPALDLCLHYDFQNINMSTDDYDIAIITYITSQISQKTKQIHCSKIIPVCSASYIKKYGLLDDINKLDKHLIVGKIDMENPILSKLTFFHEQNSQVFEVSNPSNLMVNSFLEVKTMLESGEVISALPEELVKEELSTGEFVRLLPDYNLGWLKYYMLRNTGMDDHRYKIFATFIDECIQRLKNK